MGRTGDHSDHPEAGRVKEEIPQECPTSTNASGWLPPEAPR